jgi:F0F1-type ATP synthase delta subunit
MKEGILAKRYVEALKQSAIGQDVSQVLQSVVSFSDTMLSAKDSWGKIQGPYLSMDKKITLIQELAKKCISNELAIHFLCLLTRKNRLSLLPFIAKQATQLLSELSNEVYVVVSADSGFSTKDERVLTQLIENGTKKKVKMSIIRSDDSLGGFKATVGHVVYDGTVENSIDTFKLSFN